ncbi:hypothetical protein ZEAMMB73_Zm00001d052647 [Zea mays]|uniref:Uncharacterized protein n=1 Tax=Zea mays TaxID=4577 RepID=A0A1D6QI80_MAIZE|nr:hypothetical protein ZEAMMB73_Zm00001d052647 [Zea mays]
MQIDDASLWDTTTICSNVCTRYTITAGTNATGFTPIQFLSYAVTKRDSSNSSKLMGAFYLIY